MQENNVEKCDGHIFGWRKTTMGTHTISAKATTICHSSSIKSSYAYMDLILRFGQYLPPFQPIIRWFTMYITSYIILVNRTINTLNFTRHIGSLGDEDHISGLPSLSGDWMQQITARAIWDGWCQTLYQFSTIKYDSVVILKDDEWLLWSSTAIAGGWLQDLVHDGIPAAFDWWYMATTPWCKGHATKWWWASPMNVNSDKDTRTSISNRQFTIYMYDSFIQSLWEMQHETLYHNVMWLCITVWLMMKETNENEKNKVCSQYDKCMEDR